MISAVILSHNNSSIIQKAIDSVRWCDEIIVIDDNSTDETKSIAEKSGAVVFTHALDNDFGAQRNFGLVKAGGDWVLFLDSDEIVSEELGKEIQENISNQLGHSRERGNLSYKNWIPAQGRNDIVGYFLKRTDVMWGRELRYGETAHVKLLRLAQKNRGIWDRPVHEVWNVQGKTEILSNPLLHYPHQDVAQFLSSINKYSTLTAEYMYKKGEKASLFHIVMYPAGKFIQNYFLRFGFLDGTAGAVVAIMMSMHSFLTRGKLFVLRYKK